MKHEYKEMQRVDSIWPLLLLAVTLSINWVLYFKFNEKDLKYFYITVLTALVLSGIMAITRLSTVINDKGIRFMLFPFQLKARSIGWAEIKSISVRKYKPLKEFGGWGIRWSSAGKAYTVRGNEGIQLTLNDGGQILIGTQKSIETEAAISKYFGS